MSDNSTISSLGLYNSVKTVDSDGSTVYKVNNISHSYDDSDSHLIKFSQNLTRITPNTEICRSLNGQLEKVKFGSKVVIVDESAFCDISSLAQVNATEKLKKIGAHSFENCTGLSSCGIFNYKYDYDSQSEKFLYRIGERAFANTDLRSVNINLVGSYNNGKGASYVPAYGEIGTEAFADCKNLSSVTMTYSTYLSEGMFKNCSSLKKVTLINRHGFINEGVFENCTALESFEYPASFWTLPDKMFQGCSSLTSITFKEPSSLRSLGRCVFAGCSSLTAIELPSSITSFTQIDDEFLLGSNITQVKFNGIESGDIMIGNASSTDGYVFNKLYCNDDKNSLLKAKISQCDDNGAATSKQIKISNFIKQQDIDIEDVLEFTSLKKMVKIFNYCIQKKIPILVFSSNIIGQCCSHCEDFGTEVIFTKYFKDYLNSSDTPKFIGFLDEEDATYGCDLYFRSKKYLDLDAYHKNNNKELTFVVALMYRTGSSDNYRVGTLSDRKRFKSEVIPALKKVAAGYVPSPEDYQQLIASDIFDNCCFGAYKNVTLISKSEAACVYKNQGKYIEPSIQYDSEIQVDNETTSDFKYGIWYGQAEKLRQFADEHNIPVFLQLGSKGCPPCEQFTETIYKNQDFQNFMCGSNYLLCRVVASTTEYGEPSYIIGSWSENSAVPQLMCYWKKSDGTVLKDTRYYGGTYAGDSSNYSVEQLTSWISTSFAGYVRDERFVKPEINCVYDDVPRYKVYGNIQDDTNGKYYTCVSKTLAEDQKTCTLNKTEYSVKTGNSTQVPSGTYQYFPMLSTDDTYEQNFQISGFIFKSSHTQELIATLKFDESMTVQQYDEKLMLETGSETSILSNCTAQEIQYDLYMEDDDGDWVDPPQINPEAEFEGYNLVKTYEFGDIAISSRKTNKIVFYLSAAALVTTDLDLSVDTDGGTIVSAELYGPSESAKIQYIYDFINYTIK